MPFLPCTAAARLDSVPPTGRDAAHPAICEIRLEARNAHPITELALIGHPGSKLCLTGRLREGRARRRSPDSPATHRRCPPASFCPPRERRNAGLAASPRAGHEGGRISQAGTVDELLANPASAFVRALREDVQ